MISTPPNGRAATIPQLTREMVVGGRYAWYSITSTGSRVLPWAIDDIMANFGDDIYERMLRDPQIAACLQVYKSAIVEDGVTLSSAIDDPEDPAVEVAKDLCATATDMLENLDTPFDQVLDNMLDAAAFGNKVAELKWALREIDGDNRLQLQAIKPKPRRMTAFVVDVYMNLVGVIGATPDKPFVPVGGTTFIPSSQYPTQDVIPIEKFAILSFRPQDSDPRGQSILRPAYKPWTIKQQIYPEYIKYLAQFAGPSLIGYTAEESDTLPSTDPLANPNPDQSSTQTPEEEMAAALTGFQNAMVVVFPNGYKVDPIQVQGNGQAFLQGMAQCDRQIVTAILTQTLAVSESEFMARAAAQVHQDVLDTLIRQGKTAVARMVRRVLKLWIRYNWGEALIPLCPVVSLGSIEQRHVSSLWTSVAQLMSSGYLAPEQLAGVDRILGLPLRDVTKIEPPEPEMPPAPTDQTQGTPPTDQTATPTPPTNNGKQVPAGASQNGKS